MFYAEWPFLIFCLYLPFQIALNPAAGVDLASIRVFVLLLFLLWLFSSLKKRKILIGNGATTALVLLFLFLCLLSFLSARNSDWAVRKLAYLFSIFPIYFVIFPLIDSREKLLKSLKALVFSAAAAAGIGIAQFCSQFIFGLNTAYGMWAEYATGPFLGREFGAEVLKNTSWLVNIAGKTFFRAVSVFPDPHMFAFYLGMMLPVSIVLPFAIGSKRTHWFLPPLLILLADILTFSRGAYLGLVGALIFCFLIFWKRFGAKIKLAGIVLAFISFLLLFVSNPISERFFSSFDLGEGSNAGRLEMWKVALKAAFEHPLGVGIGNFSLEVDPTVAYRNSIYAHNTYLDIAAEIGVMGAFVWVLILATTAYALYLKSRSEVLFLGLLAGLLVFSIHSVADTALYSPVDLTLFLIILGLSGFKSKYEETA